MAERDALHELAVLLDEIRQTWRPLAWPERDRMRGMVLAELYRFRARQESGATPPQECPWDVSGLVDESREHLLHRLKNALFNEAQLRDRAARVSAGAKRLRADDRAALARCADLLRHDRKTVPMEALKAALYPEMAAVPLRPGGELTAEGAGPLLDPACRAGECGPCPGAPCEHHCHAKENTSA